MKQYHIKNPKVMGEKHDTYGWSIWAESNYGPVMFNTNRDLTLTEYQIFAEEEEKRTSAKGNAYLRLKKVKIEEPSEEPVSPTPSELRGFSGGGPLTSFETKLDRIEKKIDTLLESDLVDNEKLDVPD